MRPHADGVLVGLGTVVAEQYHAPSDPRLQIYVVADVPDVSGDLELFQSGRATLILPTDAGPAPDGVPDLRAGTDGQVDLKVVAAALTGSVLIAEGGPTLAGVLAADELIDEFFASSRAPSPAAPARATDPAPPTPWNLSSFRDDGFLFLRYGRV